MLLMATFFFLLLYFSSLFPFLSLSLRRRVVIVIALELSSDDGFTIMNTTFLCVSASYRIPFGLLCYLRWAMAHFSFIYDFFRLLYIYVYGYLLQANRLWNKYLHSYTLRRVKSRKMKLKERDKIKPIKIGKLLLMSLETMLIILNGQSFNTSSIVQINNINRNIWLSNHGFIWFWMGSCSRSSRIHQDRYGKTKVFLPSPSPAIAIDGIIVGRTYWALEVYSTRDCCAQHEVLPIPINQLIFVVASYNDDTKKQENSSVYTCPLTEK